MSRRSLGAAVAFIGLALLFVSLTADRAGPAADIDTDALADRLVTQVAGIHERDLVLISGGVRDVVLLEDLAVHVRKQGAFPLVTLASERLIRRYYDVVPPRYDSQPPEFNLKLASLATAVISVDFGETLGLLADVPPERVATVSRAFQPIGPLLLGRNVRQVNLGNGLYPTAALSEQFGVSRDELTKIFWDGVNVDYRKLQEAGETVKAILERGREVQIVNPNGTDLKVRIEGRPIFVSDGVISAEDVATGGPANQVWLPAGEVFLAPIPGTAEGRVVVDRQLFQGKEIRRLTLSFKAGKLVSMTAESGLEPLKARYDASTAGRDVFAMIDIGLNPNVRIVPGSRMVAWMPAGMVTVGFGNNTWAGGENAVNFGIANFLPGSTLKVDGKVVVENGVLRI